MELWDIEEALGGTWDDKILVLENHVGWEYRGELEKRKDEDRIFMKQLEYSRWIGRVLAHSGCMDERRR